MALTGARTDFLRDHAVAVLVVAAQGSLSAAARALSTTQPTISRRIAAVEAELGVSIFHRRPSGVEPTAAGRLFIGHLRAAAYELELGVLKARTLAQGFSLAPDDAPG